MTLEVRGLHFAYQSREVIRGLDFSAEAGQCVCLLGENGAGKTTLFRCLLGLLDGYRGEILMDGADLRGLSVQARAQKIAYIPQIHSSAFHYTVFETVLMGTNPRLGPLRGPGARERALAGQALEQMEISHLAGRSCAALSGGERQLVLIARALAQQSRVLVMDEPTANLDYGNQLRVMRRIRALAGQGYLVLLSTHNPEHALRYADRVLVLCEGRVAAHGPPGQVLTPALMKRLYGVSVQMHTLQAPWGAVPVVVPEY